MQIAIEHEGRYWIAVEKESQKGCSQCECYGSSLCREFSYGRGDDALCERIGSILFGPGNDTEFKEVDPCGT
jgi:hypothetical protein